MFLKNLLISLWFYAIFYWIATDLGAERADFIASCLVFLESAVRNPIKGYYELTTLQTIFLELCGTITAILVSQGIVYSVNEVIKSTI